MATTTYGTPYVAGTDLVANWPAASLTVANSIDAAGYFVGRGTNTQTGSYTLVLTDAGKNITQAVNTANTITIPANASVAFPIGTRVNIINLGSGACTPTAGAGVTISGTITALAINEYASLVKTGTNTWSYLAAATPTAPGLSLVTPTSVAGTGVSLSGGRVTFTTATTININGCFTSTYQNYVVLMDQMQTSGASVDISVRLRAAGVDTSTSTYYGGKIYGTFAGSAGGGAANGVSSFPLATITNSPRSMFKVEVFSPQTTTITTLHSLGVAFDAQLNAAGYQSDSTAFDGFSFVIASGNLSGNATIYGYRKS